MFTLMIKQPSLVYNTILLSSHLLLYWIRYDFSQKLTTTVLQRQGGGIMWSHNVMTYVITVLNTILRSLCFIMRIYWLLLQYSHVSVFCQHERNINDYFEYLVLSHYIVFKSILRTHILVFVIFITYPYLDKSILILCASSYFHDLVINDTSR